MKVLLRATYDWADEFDFGVTEIWNKKGWEEHVATLEKYKDKLGSTEIYFGTNEFIEFYSVDEFLDAISVEDIPDEAVEYVKSACHGLIDLGCVFENQISNIIRNEIIDDYYNLDDVVRAEYEKLVVEYQRANKAVRGVTEQRRKELRGDLGYYWMKPEDNEKLREDYLELFETQSMARENIKDKWEELGIGRGEPFFICFDKC